MNLRKNIMMIVSVMVAVIIALSVLVPVIQDASASEDTFTNDGIVRMTKYGTDAEITAFWDHTKPNEITVNGDTIALPKFVTSGVEIALTTSGNADYLIRYVSATQTNQTISFVDSSGNTSAGVVSNNDATITVSGGTLTFSNGVATVTSTIDDYFFFVSADGDYVMKSSTDKSYLNGDSEVYGIGRTSVNNVYYSMFIEGNIDDGFTAEVTTGTTKPTISNVESTYSVVDSYNDLYSFEKVTFTATLNDTDYPVTYNQVIIPYEVTAERSVHVSSVEASLLGIIPLLVVIGIVIGAVWFIRQKN